MPKISDYSSAGGVQTGDKMLVERAGAYRSIDPGVVGAIPYRVSLASDFIVHDLAADGAQMLSGTFMPKATSVVVDVDAAYGITGAARGALFLYIGQPDTPGTRLYDAGGLVIAPAQSFAVGAIPHDTVYAATTHRSITLTGLDTSKAVTWQILAGIVGASESYEPLGGFGYQQFAITPDGRYGFFTHTSAGTVTKVALGRPGYSMNSLLTPQDVVGVLNTLPGGSAAAPVPVVTDGVHVVVGNHGTNTVSILDVATLTLLRTTASLGAANGVIGLAIEPNGTHVVASDLHGRMHRIQISDASVSTTIITSGNDLYSVAVSADGTSVFMANETSGYVSRHSATNYATVTGTWNCGVGSKPRQLRIAPDGSVWVLTRPNSPTVGRLKKLNLSVNDGFLEDLALPYTLPNRFAITPVAGQTDTTVRTAWVVYNDDKYSQFNIGGVFKGQVHQHVGDFGSDVPTDIQVSDFGEIWVSRYTNGIFKWPGGRFACRPSWDLFLGEYLTLSATPASAS